MNTVRPGKIPLFDCQRDSHATSQTAIYANITQTGRVRLYCSWFWVVLVGFVGGFGWFCRWFWVVLGGFGWFCVLLTTVKPNGEKPNEIKPDFKRRSTLMVIIIFC